MICDIYIFVQHTFHYLMCSMVYWVCILQSEVAFAVITESAGMNPSPHLCAHSQYMILES